MAKKEFILGKNKTKEVPNLSRGAGVLDLLTDDDDKTSDSQGDLESGEKPQQVEDDKESKKTSVKKATVAKTQTVEAVVKPKVKKDVDKKLAFSSILKSSLHIEMKSVLDDYRQNKNYKYNQAQFIEDAVVAQLAKLKRELKK